MGSAGQWGKHTTANSEVRTEVPTENARGQKEEGKSSQGRLTGKQWVKEFWSFLEVLPEDWIRKGPGREIGKLSWSKRQVSPVLALSGEKKIMFAGNSIIIILFYFQ